VRITCIEVSFSAAMIERNCADHNVDISLRLLDPSCVRSVTALHHSLGQNQFRLSETLLVRVRELRRDALEYAMNKDDYQKWVEACRKRANQPEFSSDFQNIPHVRVSNDRYARAATFRERLTLAGRQLLREMGILL
jgi:hypothetical protein